MKTFIATYLLDKENKLNINTDKPMVERIQDTIEYVFDKLLSMHQNSITL